MLYDETDHEVAALRRSIVAKETTGRTADGLPVHSFQSLLADLATYNRMTAVTALNPDYLFTLHTRPTAVQSRAFERLGFEPSRTQ